MKWRFQMENSKLEYQSIKSGSNVLNVQKNSIAKISLGFIGAPTTKPSNANIAASNVLSTLRSLIMSRKSMSRESMLRKCMTRKSLSRKCMSFTSAAIPKKVVTKKYHVFVWSTMKRRWIRIWMSRLEIITCITHINYIYSFAHNLLPNMSFLSILGTKIKIVNRENPKIFFLLKNYQTLHEVNIDKANYTRKGIEEVLWFTHRESTFFICNFL